MTRKEMERRLSQGFRSSHIARLLSSTANVGDCGIEPTSPISNEAAKICSVDSRVVYALFLEEIASPTNAQTFTTWLTDEAIRMFDTSPTIPPQLVHTELLISPDAKTVDNRVLFATYLGSDGAGWQNVDERDSGVDFYLVQNGSRWRAVPVAVDYDGDGMRCIADANVGAPYSLAMYVTSAPFIRTLAGMWSDASKAKGHCAVLTARVLKAAGCLLSRPSAWYSPTSLYNEIHAVCVKDATTTADCDKLDCLDVDSCTSATAALLHGPLSKGTVCELGDDRCRDAVRQLTENVYTAERSMDTAAIRRAQMQLANVLLKWVLLRN